MPARLRRAALGLLTIGVAVALASPSQSADAMAVPRDPRKNYRAASGDGQDNGNQSTVRLGNGKNNRNYLAMGGTRASGALHQVSIGVGGVSTIQGTYCKRRTRVCKVSQNIMAPFRRHPSGKHGVSRMPPPSPARGSARPAKHR
ncbi:hypothetical protein ACQP1K_28070 [Sphaerimonospora sp. CA-214678]|uniref:hypothetical protein n=1 Tax=Sphaerimonospora sp. CA-214678 TaxID=3240029 RepID=UPI003D900EBF